MTPAAQLAQAHLVEPRGNGIYAVACSGTCGGTAAHHVTLAGEVTACDCPAGGFGRACRHVAAVRQHLVVAPLEVTIASAAGPGLERDVPLPDDQADGSA